LLLTIIFSDRIVTETNIAGRVRNLAAQPQTSTEHVKLRFLKQHMDDRRYALSHASKMFDICSRTCDRTCNTQAVSFLHAIGCNTGCNFGTLWLAGCCWPPQASSSWLVGVFTLQQTWRFLEYWRLWAI